MTYAIAAAGTGGHVYPGLAVGEALVARGVPRSEVLFVGGARLEAAVYPEAGFPFLKVELRGLRRSLSPSNLALPAVVARAVRRIRRALGEREVGAALGMGGYVTVPAAIAARMARVPLAVSEQNAEAGLANRLASRLAARVFGSFPVTAGLRTAEWVGNPIRRPLACFDRAALAPAARERYRLERGAPVLGVFGGSLGAGAVNQAVEEVVEGWEGPELQVLHLAGTAHADALRERAERAAPVWRVLGFEERMDLFYAACDLVVARAGGAVAELTATATPAVLVPGGFGSGHHQEANARALEQAGAAVVVEEEELGRLPTVVSALLADPARREAMAAACRTLARPGAADEIAAALEGMHG